MTKPTTLIILGLPLFGRANFGRPNVVAVAATMVLQMNAKGGAHGGEADQY